MGLTVPQHRLKYETPRERTERRKMYEKMMETWQLTVGFRIHMQVKSKYKMFSTALCETNAAPNTHANFVDLALPLATIFSTSGNVSLAILAGS